MSTRRELADNRRLLATALDAFADYLARALAGEPTPLGTYLETPPALAALSQRLGLNRFEQDVLLLVVASELDARFRILLAQAQGDEGKPWASFDLALALLPDPDWGAVTPVGRLRRWCLLELAGGGGPLQARLVVDECILHQVAGLSYPDPRLEPWFRPVPGTVANGGDPDIARLAEQWQAAPNLAATPIARLEEGDGEAFARSLAAQLELRLYRLHGSELPAAREEREQLARLWEREALLRGALLWVEVEHPEPDRARRLADFLDGLQGLVLLSGEGSLALRRGQWRVDWRAGDAAGRQALWEQAMGERGAGMNGRLGAIAEQFQLSAASIARIAGDWNGTPEQLWDACRREARRDLDQLAQRVDSHAGWDDLVLPEPALASLRTLAAQVRQRTRVYRDWGFAARGARGLGISALFVGGSGTGKTLAAEVLAGELRLDLYRIDLAALVSKYIGETEKNLARLFAAAERSGAILLFDEADALFGKRSEVRDSHDRYANLEVSYLLQRIETYRGLAILTSNLKQSIDNAFQRRLRFIVQFPFPDAEARGAIWARVFPADTPLAGLDLGKLARLSLSGGHIRNLALNAAFLAADEDRPVSMRHLRCAAEAEFAKLEKPLAPADMGDWS
ncbi:AAA family ATPase [Zestomonas carbonaria]|uniref:ATP-dependent zinc metalloprotease FtsH n=1 Tax=Zestomonas carbonaria TaxID=2762745 RepID=A0A7U7EPJ5_9GAMM|nr:ATP-binding protein [Pseudomonas carbonaria]CAD5108373.1 ATP-dependent zinc metalloprotease FtsH [Pseudomonas carbonaria]